MMHLKTRTTYTREYADPLGARPIEVRDLGRQHAANALATYRCGGTKGECMYMDFKVNVINSVMESKVWGIPCSHFVVNSHATYGSVSAKDEFVV